MWRCSHCDEGIENDFDSCWNCGYGKDGTPPAGPKVFEHETNRRVEMPKGQNKSRPKEQKEERGKSQRSDQSTSTGSTGVGTGAISTLKFFAWLDLIAGFIGGIWIWVEFGKRVTPGYSYLTESNPIAIVVGVAVLLQGIFACAFFLVVASIAENLIAIRKNTT